MTRTKKSRSDDDAPLVTRGENPEPPDGWSWALTDYEVEYIRQYNARPPRIDNWPADDTAEKRLDDEAEGVRAHYGALRKPKRTWPLRGVVAVVSLILAAGLGLATFGIIIYSQALGIASEASQVEQQLND